MGWALKFSSGMHWIKLGLEVLKHAWKSFPLLMHTDVWGQPLLALGPSRDIPGAFCLEIPGPTWPRTHPRISQPTHHNQTHNRAYTQGDDPHIWGEVDTTGGGDSLSNA